MAKITIGERAGNWATAFMTLWPLWALVLGTLGYTNKDRVMGWIVQPDGQTEITKGLTFEESVIKNSQEVRIELDGIKANTEAIEAQLSEKRIANYRALKTLVEGIDARVSIIEELVQP